MPRHGIPTATGGIVALLLTTMAVARAQPGADPPLDPLQQAVVDSLAQPPRTEPADLLAAAIIAADVDALAVAGEYLDRLKMVVDKTDQAARGDLLADLADATSEAALNRLAARLGPRQPEIHRLLADIGEAGRQRRRAPEIMARAVEELDAPTHAARVAAAERLAGAGIDALPAIVPAAAGEGRRAELARGLLARLGPTARQPLLDWLGTGDPGGWAAVIAALDASGADGVEPFLFAPALVPGTPPSARDAARDSLAARGVDPTAAGVREAAIAMLADRIDRVLSPAGLPEVDHLLLEPVRDPADAAAAFGGNVRGTVERAFWNPAGSFEHVAVPPRVARAREALHAARDLAALDTRDPALVDLVLLARLEAALVTAGDPLTVLERVPPEQLREPLSGPDGFSLETAGRVFGQAIERGMWEAAAAAAQSLAPGGATATGPSGSRGTLPAAVRESLVRALAVPDAAVQFAAARALALAAGEPPYRGSSRVIEVLAHAATARGVDRAVVAHPDAVVAQELAAGVSRHGFEPVRVSSGRQAIFAARSSADTVLVLLAARIATPTALETVEFLQQQGLGDIPAVLVLVDPLDDDGRGAYLTSRILAFCDLHRIGLADRLESLFLPAIDPDTGTETGPPRFADLLAQAAGPAAVDPTTRTTAAAVRLGRARESLSLLGRLGRRGQDVTPAMQTALLALAIPELQPAAASLLAAMGRAEAQTALEAEAARADLPEAARLVARAAFESSVERWGIMLDSRQMLAAYARYNRAADDTSRGAAGGILNVIEAAGRKSSSAPDAASLRTRR